MTGEGVEAFGDFLRSEGAADGCEAEGGEDVFGVGEIAGEGVEISETTGVALSGSGLTEGTADLKVSGVATGSSVVSSEGNEIVDSDQLIDGLKR
jgi:type IV secretory pathway TrbL component